MQFARIFLPCLKLTQLLAGSVNGVTISQRFKRASALLCHTWQHKRRIQFVFSIAQQRV